MSRLPTNSISSTLPTEFDARDNEQNNIRSHSGALTSAPQAIHDSKQSAAADVVTEKPFSIFTSTEKWLLATTASIVGFFSPLTANIYFPAISIMSTQFHKSVELINLTVTVYMIMQGLSPMFWGTLSDRWGRRPMFLGCLVLLAVSSIGLALTPTSAYWLLILLRCVQAGGSASTIAIGAGIVADVATPAERGGLFGLVSFGPMVGPAVGPVIGGGLTQGLGWRSIFWFLAISSGACAAAVFLFLPETLRSMVGDGSYSPPVLYKPPIPLVGRNRKSHEAAERPPPKPFNNPLRLFTEPDVVVLLLLNGIIYAPFYSITASISILFEEVYPFLNQTDIGLCFLAIGGGMMVGTLVTGRLLDWEYRSIEDKLMREGKVDPEQKMSARERAQRGDFPVELARLRMMPFYFVIYVGCTIGYGWCLVAKVNIAGPLILSYVIGHVLVSMMNAVQTLLVDLVPAQGSSITACNNLVRCSLGAILVSVINIMLGRLGAGWTYVVLAGTCIASAPLFFIELKWGPVWRERRRKRLAGEQ